MTLGSDDLDVRRALDEFDFVPVRGIDENEAAAGRCCSRPVRNSNLLGAELFNGVIKVLDLEGQVDEVFRTVTRPLGGKLQSSISSSLLGTLRKAR